MRGGETLATAEKVGGADAAPLPLGTCTRVLSFYFVFETRSPSVALAGLKLSEISLPLPAGIKGVCPHSWPNTHSFFVCLLFIFEAGSHCLTGCPRTHHVDQAGLELTEVHKTLTSKCWD